MTNESMTIKVPGKLMIAGEYAILEAHQRSIVTAVDRFVYATICSASENRVSLPKLGLENIPWEVNSEKIHIKTKDSRVNFVENAMDIVCRYIMEQGNSLEAFDLTINSELDDESGIKYGLGSSAAVVTAVVKAVLKYHKIPCPSEILFKLAAIAHVETQGSGSGADVAASSYGGMVAYTSFQADWLKDAYRASSTIVDLVNQNWPYLSVEAISLPDNVQMLIGWTGSPASTKDFIKKINKLKSSSPELYEQFIEQSSKAVGLIMTGVETNNSLLVLEGITANRNALAELGTHANAPIETTLLKQLADIAEKHGGAGKPSGAGGGDCGIAFFDGEEAAERVKRDWLKNGIKPLSLNIFITL